jgi:tRNA-2-methylthio-N6-dimethylallyladenosine synthase
MNQSDAERIATHLEKYKIKTAASIDAADLILFVTCGVRQSAEDRVYGQINNIKKKYPEKIVILTGCLAHHKDVQRRLKGKVDLFCETKNFPEEMKEILNTRYKPYNDYLSITPKYTNPYTAYVPIMTGCDNFCAYCIVPYARGREYSRPAEDILKEVKGLVKKGCKEIILLGQNVNSYLGRDKNSSAEEADMVINFPKLLHLIENIQGNFWLTFLTSHPKDMSNELIETIAKSKKICEYISLPAQSGDNGILRQMNRKYSIERYRGLIKKIRAAYKKQEPDIFPSISTDIIVGFPGETKKQFENSAQLLREMKFDMAYIAQYSPRPETAAWKMKDNVSKKEKERREKVLTEILSKTALANNKKYVGKIVDVLVDADSKGHTRTQKHVVFHSDKKIPVGSFAKVKITKAKAFGLEGKII